MMVKGRKKMHLVVSLENQPGAKVELHVSSTAIKRPGFADLKYPLFEHRVDSRLLMPDSANYYLVDAP